MRYFGEFMEPSAFVSPSVLAEKIYQWRYGIPPQGPVEEAVVEGAEAARETIFGPSAPAPIMPMRAENGTMVLLAGALGIWLLTRTVGRRRR